MSDMISIHQRVMNMIARGRLAASNDDEGMQFVDLSLLRGESKARVERFQTYGFSSHAPRGSEVIALFLGGSRDHGVVLAIDNRRSRIRGQREGEVAMYTDEGDYLVLRRGNSAQLRTKFLDVKAEDEFVLETEHLIIKAQQIEIEGDVHLKGNLTVDGNINASGGNITQTGDINVTGNITATGSINAPSGSVGP
ncbi:MAG: phage baseplate assembly protein V [Alphaproteobacteria bacterium]|nr:phage baseplate assembly protein V [Alphaproteobacteria bacterium]